MAALEQLPLLTDGHRRDGRAYEEFRNVCESAPRAMGRPLACLTPPPSLTAACCLLTPAAVYAVLKTGVISQASGSAYAEFNNTKVRLLAEILAAAIAAHLTCDRHHQPRRRNSASTPSPALPFSPSAGHGGRVRPAAERAQGGVQRAGAHQRGRQAGHLCHAAARRVWAGGPARLHPPRGCCNASRLQGMLGSWAKNLPGAVPC